MQVSIILNYREEFNMLLHPQEESISQPGQWIAKNDNFYASRSAAKVVASDFQYS
jgi:hypothetical protein